jgi:hypothetical protein
MAIVVVEAVDKWAVLFCPLIHNLPRVKGEKTNQYISKLQ